MTWTANDANANGDLPKKATESAVQSKASRKRKEIKDEWPLSKRGETFPNNFRVKGEGKEAKKSQTIVPQTQTL